ncbi:MAG: indolepyruvate ferredoxin oxidoreductase family protein [Gammaproteobacteria bacterium]|nr:indolepyruvate ferredoxin oxidoreductase family protein [Gammaproteobacteria bacterium]
MTLPDVSLEDKYTQQSGRVFLSGTHALVRLVLEQRRRDAARGWNTAGYVTGYRGSPLGAFDQQMSRAKRHLEAQRIVFQPAVNEDLAATALWGTQQLGLFDGASVDGVFGVWYGKGPGVDRSGDVLRHANLAGTAPRGGVLALAGDDHAAKSSTVACQSELSLIDLQMPVLYPATVGEIIEYGLYGIALSRYAALWTALKILPETADLSSTLVLPDDRVEYRVPGFDLPPDGLHLRWPDPALEQEARLHRYRLPAARAFLAANPLDRVVVGGPAPRFGIVTSGKSHPDVMQALATLGILPAEAQRLGLALYKVGALWPLEEEGLRRFARGLTELFVIEEKRAVLEPQIKEALYNLPAGERPQVVGKRDERGAPLVPSEGDLSPERIARFVAARLAGLTGDTRLKLRLAALEQAPASVPTGPAVERIPHFCSGCPHNSSTVVPEGSRALAGIGCHYMAQWMDRNTATFTHMGGEGASWIGQQPFTTTPHVFVNLGDGTYNHSGLLAIRAAVAAGVNVTYKLLYNDAVAMTGGQQVDGHPSVAQITHQLHGEGVRRIVIVTDEPARYADRSALAAGVTVHERHALDAVQRELREIPGVTVLVYEQTCGTEKRRRRKRGLLADPARRTFIHPLVCEGCGDCGVQSNCLAVLPLETEFGRKRQIDQSACNKDFRCVDGLCPSFVTVHGGELRQPQAIAADLSFPELPEPEPAAETDVYSILVTGVGGTGVVTIGALLGMAAHLDGRHCQVLDQTGLAQKFGAVMSHIQISARPDRLHAGRIAEGGADLVLGADLVTAATPDALKRFHPERTHALLNTHTTVVSGFTRNADLDFQTAQLLRRVATATGGRHVTTIDATGLATALLGDSIATNLFLVGHAWQRGLVPLSAAAIERAIELNGVGVELNRRAFLWGRRAAHDLGAVTWIVHPADPLPPVQDLDGMIARRMAFLTDYQDAAYAARYAALVARVRDAEARMTPGRDGLAAAAARAYFKLLACKDEYEVARLFVESDFLAATAARFTGDHRIHFHLAPPLFARRDPANGRQQKREYGPWLLRFLRLLRHGKRLRGTAFDVFGYTRERRMERQLVTDYEALVAKVIASLDHDTHDTAVALLALPERVRGYGLVKERAIADMREQERALLAALAAPAALQAAG